MISDIIAWQIHQYMEYTYGDNYALQTDLSQYLINELWKSGELYDWEDRLFLATGSPLNIAGYLQHFL